MTPEEMAQYVRQIVDAAPPLTEQQRAQLARIIHLSREDFPSQSHD